jgi:hypothetical protein
MSAYRVKTGRAVLNLSFVEFDPKPPYSKITAARLLG